MTDEEYMQLAMTQAQKAAARQEVPVGAVLVYNNEIIAECGNNPISKCDPTAHAEIEVLRAAALKLKNYRLPGASIFVTLEPCVMCMGAIVHARISRLVYGASDPKTGAVKSIYEIGTDKKLNHIVKITGGVMEPQCSQLLKEFFRQKRANTKL